MLVILCFVFFVCKQKFCSSLLSLLPSAGATNSSTMSSELHIEVLTAMRIASREQYGITELTLEYSIEKLLRLAGLVNDVKKAFTEINHDNLTMQGNITGLNVMYLLYKYVPYCIFYQ